MEPLRILIVEDDLMVGPLFAEMLEDLGHVVCAVETHAERAVAAAARCKPDVMIVDIGLADEDGISAVREILRHGFVPHVFVTGDVIRDAALDLETVFIQKPFRAPDIQAAIRHALAQRADPEDAELV